MTSRTLRWRLITAAWAVKIFWLSTESFSGELSGHLLLRVLHLLHVSISGYAFSFLHVAFRKTAHVVEYALLGFFLYRSFEVQEGRPWQPRLALHCLTGSAAYSLADEFHQFFVRGRGASLVDCGLDTIGAAMAMLFLYWVYREPGRRADPRTVYGPVSAPPGDAARRSSVDRFWPSWG